MTPPSNKCCRYTVMIIYNTVGKFLLKCETANTVYLLFPMKIRNNFKSFSQEINIFAIISMPHFGQSYTFVINNTMKTYNLTVKISIGKIVPNSNFWTKIGT